MAGAGNAGSSCAHVGRKKRKSWWAEKMRKKTKIGENLVALGPGNNNRNTVVIFLKKVRTVL